MNNYSIYLVFCLSVLFSNSLDPTINKNILPKQIVEVDSDTTKSIIPEDVFIAQLEESKILLSDAIMSDITGDTLSAIFSFEKLFESLAIIDEIIDMDEWERLDYNKLLTTAITYFESKALTVNKLETGLSVAMIRDKLDEYTYSQRLDELEFVEETIEVIEGHIPITYNTKVKSIIKFFQGPGHRSIQNWLNRMNKFKVIILPILERENVPPELFYLAMIESGLKPNAYSYAHASGVWQFIASTGKEYGLKKNWWVDERRDFEKSTVAAARYLKFLHKELGDWYLAFAAYNCGLSRVQRHIRVFGTDDFWELNNLPAQTRNYVPNILAAIFIANNPEKYGFSVNPEPLMEWRDIYMDKSVSIESLSKISGVDKTMLLAYNPELKQGIIPPLDDGDKYKFRLPLIADSSFDSLYLTLKDESVEEIVFVDHKVKYGENLTLIAKKYGASINEIVSVNKISNPNAIKPRSILKIPMEGYKEYISSTDNKVVHTVRFGDTLSEIAMKYSTSVKKIKQLNGLRNDIVRTGQKLQIYVSADNKKSDKVEGSSRKIIYIVKSGDTLSEIAEDYKTSAKQIRRWNRLSNNKIRIGQKLIIWR